MGRGSSKAAQKQRVEKIKSLKKQLTSAKRVETKAYKEFASASGAERMSPNANIRNERRAATTATHEKYVDAQNKVEKLERKINKLLKTNEKQAGQLSF